MFEVAAAWTEGGDGWVEAVKRNFVWVFGEVQILPTRSILGKRTSLSFWMAVFAFSTLGMRILPKMWFGCQTLTKEIGLREAIASKA